MPLRLIPFPMKIRLLTAARAALAASVSAPRAAACAACAATAMPPESASAPAELPSAENPALAPAGHPLRGVVVDIRTDRQALLVKHEEIPGIMKAMTMLLKVDATTLAAAKKGQAITATLVEKTDGWWLENVKPVTSEN